ncbi:MAG: response regulator [Roseburia sp.]|nr:response regulator [Roseburia sp.]
MRSIVYVAKINVVSQGIKRYLSDYFEIASTEENTESVKAAMEKNRPDLVLIGLEDGNLFQKSIISELAAHYGKIPVICLGTKEGWKKLELNVEDAGSQFMFLSDKAENEELLNKICQRLEITVEPKGQKRDTSDNGKKHLLLVDDNAIQLRSLRGMFQGIYDTDMATSVKEAILLIGKRIPDLIVLDYEMPVHNGKEALELLRSREETKHIPVIILTGKNKSKDIKAVLRLKPDAYLLKPITKEKMLNVIEDIFNRQTKSH